MALQVPPSLSTSLPARRAYKTSAAANQQPIGGLVSGNTYYVINATRPASSSRRPQSGTQADPLNATDSAGSTPSAWKESTSRGLLLAVTHYLVFPLNTTGARGTYQLVPEWAASTGRGFAKWRRRGECDGGRLGRGPRHCRRFGCRQPPPARRSLRMSAPLLTSRPAAISRSRRPPVANTSADGTNQGGGFVAVGGGSAERHDRPQRTVRQSAPGPTSPRRATSRSERRLSTTWSLRPTPTAAEPLRSRKPTRPSTSFPKRRSAVGANAQITAGANILVESQSDTTANQIFANADGERSGQ